EHVAKHLDIAQHISPTAGSVSHCPIVQNRQKKGLLLALQQRSPLEYGPLGNSTLPVAFTTAACHKIIGI
ncbi:unnamed protein product, partial [Ceratitis capitata]